MNLFSIGILVFIALTLVLVGLVVWKSRTRKKLGAKELEYIKSHWIRVIDSFNGNPRSAIMDADKILDYTLGKHGFVGTLGEKLKKAGPRFSDLNGVWFAHKIRNKVAHELDEMNLDEAKRALAHFKKALNDLGSKL